MTPRAARPTFRFVDEYCEQYADLFPEVRNFEACQYLRSHCLRVNNLRLVIEPGIAFNRLQQWWSVFLIPRWEPGFAPLIEPMQQFYCPVMHDLLVGRILFNSA